MTETSRKEILRSQAFELGASAFGVCEIVELVETFHPKIRDTARTLPVAIAVGVALQKTVLDTLTNRPNDIYKSHYRATNVRLDGITYSLARTIADFGARVIPIPASMIVTRYPLLAHVNHREIAYKAGLGWRGNNNLLVSPTFGGRLRLTTLLTDCELEPDTIVDRDCGKCTACRKVCPAGAIGKTPGEFSLDACQRQVEAFCKQDNFGQLICGLCLNRCPHDGGACG